MTNLASNMGTVAPILLNSVQASEYFPFLLSPTEDDPRGVIKRYFLEKGLAVSVRPPYSKGFLDGVPLAFFRCRIQTGGTDFQAFPKNAF